MIRFQKLYSKMTVTSTLGNHFWIQKLKYETSKGTISEKRHTEIFAINCNECVNIKSNNLKFVAIRR
jgi:hypothetical protein